MAPPPADHVQGDDPEDNFSIGLFGEQELIFSPTMIRLGPVEVQAAPKGAFFLLLDLQTAEFSVRCTDLACASGWACRRSGDSHDGRSGLLERARSSTTAVALRLDRRL